MKALLTRTTTYIAERDKKDKIIEINSLEELLELMRAEGHDLVIIEASMSLKEKVDFEIEVYDYYRE
jgi:hypothetical protein